MPFTFSHPAIVLPLARLSRRWVSATGLVIGSIIPDFEKFLKMNDGNTYSHTLKGLFWFDLPLALLLSFLFHLIIRDPLIDHSPFFLRNRFSPVKSFSWTAHFKKHFLVVMGSILLGGASHIAWDSFTHKRGKAVLLLPLLQQDIYLSPLGTFRVYYLLDLLSSVIGRLIVLFFIIKLPIHQIPFSKNRQIHFYWLTVCYTALAVTLLRIGLGPALKHVWDVAIVFIASYLIGVTVASLIFKVRGVSKVGY